MAEIPTREQLQQGEQIVNLALTEEEAAAVTLTQLGLRVQGVTLAQDATDARQQEQATAIDEHQTLYEDHEEPQHLSPQQIHEPPVGFFRQFATPRPIEVPRTVDVQQPMSQYFRTLPARRPSFGSPTHMGSEDLLVSTPSSESQRSANMNQSSSAPGEQQDNIDLGVESVSETNVQEEQESSFDPPHVTTGGEDARSDADSLHQSSDSDAAYSFASERSIHEEDQDVNDLEAEMTAEEYMVGKLYEQLIVEFHGCSMEKHEEALREHLEAAGENHHSLGQVFNDPDFPSVLGLGDVITPDRLARQAMPSATQWESMYCGRSRQRRYPANVCLHKEETQEVEAKIAYDVDSFLGFGTSLAMARKGVWCQFVPQMRQNIVADVHVQTTAFHTGDDPEQAPRASSAMLRDIPHFLLGRVVGAHDVTIHVLFPHLTVTAQKFSSLTREQLTRWLDRVFLPAVHNVYDADYTQHLPGNFDHAYANSKAHQVEGRQVQTASYEAQHAVGYHLQPEHLEQIWNDMVTTINTMPGLADFRDAQLFFSAKGTKLHFKTRTSMPTLLDVMEFFESFFDDIIDRTFIQLDRLYVDVGKEICPRVHMLSRQTPHIDDEAQVYVRRRCCLEEYMRWMYDGQPPRMGSGQLYFTQNMLREACSLTSVTPMRSKHRAGGLIYSQFYASVKEISDATKRFPFTNDGMEEMALDPQIRRGARQALGGHRRDAKIVELAYLASKRRTRDALAASRQKSFGIREEHRITWRLFQALMHRLRLEDRDSFPLTLSDCPSYAWPIKTSVYLDFLWRSADKFATGFEVVLARCRKDMVTWEQTKMMAMFLRCLRFVFGGHLLRRESALWWSRRERHVGEPARLRIWYGLGFSNTLPRYGYCWLEPRVDWTQLQFKSEVTDHVLFGNGMLRGQYLRRGGQARAFFDTTRRMELALDWLRQHKDVEVVRERLIGWIVHICLQQFRVDVMQCVKAEIEEPQRDAAVTGSEPFCLESLERVMSEDVYLMSGNRCDFKVVSHLGQFLFNFDDGRMRNHWEDRPFRKLYRRAVTAVALLGREMRRTFQGQFWKTLYQHHWVLPYPCPDALMQTTKQGRRMWYSIQVREGVEAQEATTKDWAWARKSWQPGTPKALPWWMEWEKEAWERWIEERAG